MGQVVDTETAKEFMAETLARVDVGELAAIRAEVEAKSVWFRDRLAADRLPALDAAEFAAVLDRVFAVRGKARRALQASDWPPLREQVAALLHGPGDAAARLQAFVDALAGADGFAENLRVDLASELLHFTDPDRHWLWTRWMWDPRTRTGALPLVTTAAFDLRGGSAAEIYPKVGRAVAFVHEVGEAAGFRRIGGGIFGTDVFLCCVYVVYTYTVLRMRMTKEFNKVVPQLPEFCRRLLGVHVKAVPPAGRAARGPGGGDGPETR
jgi:hypothetical protein